MTDKQKIEHELLYEGLEWSVGVDGMFINPKHIPYTNCLYEIALACDSKSKQLQTKEDKINKIEDICDDILENYMKHSLACVDLAGKITDIINDIKQEVNNDR